MVICAKRTFLLYFLCKHSHSIIMFSNHCLACVLKILLMCNMLLQACSSTSAIVCIMGFLWHTFWTPASQYVCTLDCCPNYLLVNCKTPLWDELDDPFRVLEQTPLPLIPNQHSIGGLLLARADWKETQNAHIIRLDVPGMQKNDVKIEVDEQHGRVLKVSGERKAEEEEEREGDKWHRVERARGKFSRQFRLPLNADLDHIKAKLEHGVLKIVVPKIVVEDIKRRNKVIDIDAVDKSAEVEDVKTTTAATS